MRLFILLVLILIASIGTYPIKSTEIPDHITSDTTSVETTDYSSTLRYSYYQ